MRERIAELAARFLQRCALEVASSRDLATRLRSGDAGAFKEWEHLAHRIRGTGASLGFGSLSTCAAAIERLAESQPGNATPDPKVTERLVEYTGQLEEEINRLVQLPARFN
jgi:HPt (histidine-containing phosphotransfer) domain-containing protein